MLNQNKISILLADDDLFTREGIRTLLGKKAPDIEIIGETGSGNGIKQLIADLRPQILLLDLVMPNLIPAEQVKWVCENYPNTTVLILSSHTDERYLANMMEAGAAGCLDKGVLVSKLISEIRRAADGHILFDKIQQDKASQWRKNIGDKIESLTDQERAILKCLAQGMDNKEIAAKLDVTITTVSFHTKNIFVKLQVKSRLQAALWARDNLPDNLYKNIG
ncbi:MAG: response regulator transcription factor [Anaerolineales bacterium]|nr:response regulator transcription factor [Anaerolineales bacterium]